MSNILLLGMVYSEEFEPKRGQEFRDRVRCLALENMGNSVKTLDNKHDDTDIQSGKHCRANFADARRMLKSIRSKWGNDVEFDDIILDYFFSPVGWARERWTDGLFEKTLPLIASEGLLKKGGKIFLPNLENIHESLKDFDSALSPYYHIYQDSEPKNNLLFVATAQQTCEKELLRCPDTLINSTQMEPLWQYSKCPFYVLQLRDEFLTSPIDKKKKNVSYVKNMSSNQTSPLKKTKISY